MSKFSLEQQIEEVERELGLRVGVYRRDEVAHPSNKSKNEFFMARMRGVLETLKFIQAHKEEYVHLVNLKREKGELPKLSPEQSPQDPAPSSSRP